MAVAKRSRDQSAKWAVSTNPDAVSEAGLPPHGARLLPAPQPVVLEPLRDRDLAQVGGVRLADQRELFRVVLCTEVEICCLFYSRFLM